MPGFEPGILGSKPNALPAWLHPISDDFMQLKFRFLTYLIKLYVKKYFYVAYSGGLDSRVLADLLFEYIVFNKFNYNLIILHVNHHYCNIFSDFWEYFCINLHLQIPVIIVKIKLQKRLVDISLENFFRLLRLFAFEIVINNKISSLFLAHHLNDQKETVFENLLHGKKCIFGITLKIYLNKLCFLRPLLQCTKQWLLQYACEYNLIWVTDVSNFSVFFLRNFLRNYFLPIVKFVYPFFIISFKEYVYFFSCSNKFTYTICELIFLSICDGCLNRINLDKFMCLSVFLKKEVLKYWFFKNFFSVKIIRKKILFLYSSIFFFYSKYFFIIFDKYFFFRFNTYIYIILR